MAAFLDVSGVIRTFGGIHAVDNVSLSVPEGATYGVIGPNGAGKTVLLNLISGVYRVESGTIHIGGVRTDQLRSYRVAKQGVARTFQSMEQFKEFSVDDYVMLGRRQFQQHSIFACALSLPGVRRSERDERKQAVAALDRFDLAPFAKERMAELPYGVQKQIDIARVVAGEPRLMLLDEPTSGTTSTERGAIAEILRTIAVSETSITVVLVDHDVRFVSEHCEFAMVMNEGRMLAEGTPQEVLASEAVITAYLGG